MRKLSLVVRTFVLAASALASSIAHSAPIVSGSYYEERVLKNCNNATSCRLDYAAMPARIMLNTISCFIESAQPLKLIRLGLGETLGGDTGRSDYIPFQENSTGNGRSYYTINQPIHFLVGRNRYVFIVAFTTTAPSFFEVNCRLAGEVQE